MSAQIIDGKAIATQHLLSLKQAITQQQAKPCLAVLLIEGDSASALYVAKKRQAAAQVGILNQDHHLPQTTSEGELLALIDKLNQNPDIHGILVQLPLPAHINTNVIIEAISPHKDVDGFHPYNLGRLAARTPLLRPCTPFGIIKLLEST